MDSRREKVVIETARYRIEADMTLPTAGYRSRLSDHVNRRDVEFFTLQDARLTSLDGSTEPWEAPVIMVATRHVNLIVPAGEV